MALVARMRATEVTTRFASGWEQAEEGDEGAQRPADVFVNYVYGVPFWLRDFEWIRPNERAVQETFKLDCVRSGGEDDPNNDYFVASPSGTFTMSIENPAGQEYVKAGMLFRVTIERIRGPRNTGAPEG